MDRAVDLRPCRTASTPRTWCYCVASFVARLAAHPSARRLFHYRRIENVDARPFLVGIRRPLLPAVQYHKVSFSKDAFELDPLPGKLFRHTFKVGDEGRFAVRDVWVV